MRAIQKLRRARARSQLLCQQAAAAAAASGLRSFHRERARVRRLFSDFLFVSL